MAPHRRLRKFQNIIKIRGPGISKTKKIEVRLCCSAESRSRISSITRSGSDDSLHVSGPNNVDRSRSDEKAEEIESRKDVDVVMDGAAELTDYRKRKLREEKSWDDKRGVLQVAFMKQQFLPTNANCISCIENGSASPRKAVCRCQDCGCQQLLCLQCASARHNNYNIFHVLEIWKVSMSIIDIVLLKPPSYIPPPPFFKTTTSTTTTFLVNLYFLKTKTTKECYFLFCRMENLCLCLSTTLLFLHLDIKTVDPLQTLNQWFLLICKVGINSNC